MLKTLTEWRLEKNWSMNELARRAGVSRHTVEFQENGSARVKASTALKLANALGLDDINLIIWPGGISSSTRGCNSSPRGARKRLGDEPPPVHSLRWWRFRRDLSIESLAKKAELGHNTIWRIETSYHSGPVHEQTARQLADALGLLDIHEIRWPYGVTDRGCPPGVSGPGVRKSATKPAAETAICTDCFMQKSNIGKCGCDW